MKVEMKLAGLEGVLSTLQQLPAEVVSKKGGPVKAALRKGALVILNEAKRNLAVAIAQPGKSGITESTGFTEKNVVMRRKVPNGINGERYIITVTPKAHPTGGTYRRKSRRSGASNRKERGRKLNAITANAIAFFLEYGTSKQAATPWLRPAFKTKAAESISTIERELVKGIDRIVKKLAAANKGR